MGGSWSNSRASDCAKLEEDYSRVVAAKAGFMVSVNSDKADKRANQITTDGFKWMEGNQPYSHFGSDSSMRRNQTPQKRGNKGIDLNKQPHKRMRMKKHRPKVFDETKPKKTSTSKTRKTKTPIPKTPKPKTPRNANYVKKQSLNVPVDSVNVAGCCGRGKSRRGKSSSRRKLDFCRENQAMDQNLNLKAGVEFQHKERLNLPVDASYCDFDGSSSAQILVFSMTSKGDKESEAGLKKEDLNIRVDSLKDPCCWDLDRSFSRQSLDFSCIRDWDLKPSDVVENETEVEPNKQALNIPIDSLKDDCDMSSTEQNLNFIVENCMMHQNLKAYNGIEAKPVVEPKLCCVDSFSGPKVYQRRFKGLKSILDKNSMACGGIEHKQEVESKLHFANSLNHLKVYQRKFPKKTYIMDEKSRSCDGTGNEQELQSEVPSDQRFSGLKFSRRNVVPNFPNLYKKKRKRRQRGSVISFKFVGPTSRPQRQRKMTARFNSYSMEENSKKSFTENMPRNEVEHPTFDNCTLNCTWIRTAKRNGFRLRRRRFSCIFKGFHSKALRKKRSKTSSRRKDISSLINVIHGMQKCITQKLKEHFPETPDLIPKAPLEHSPELSLDNEDCIEKALLDYLVMIMESLHISDVRNQLVVRDQTGQGTLVTSKVNIGPSKKRKQLPKVDLDSETMRVWNLLMENGKSGQSEDPEQQEDDKAEYWREQRAIFNGRVESFIARTHFIQGDRRFSQWKGSVVDSVVGVFLTQNVSDHLSSSAFMNLAAQYPPSPVKDTSCDDRSDYVNEIHHLALGEPSSINCDELSIVQKYSLVEVSTPNNNVESEMGDVCEPSFQMHSTIEKQKDNAQEKQESKINWDDLRTQSTHGKSKIRTNHTQDSVNWEAVRQAPVEEVAKVIMERGMNNMLAKRIKDFLDRLVRDHGSIDLEWLRDVEPDKSKEYLLSITGLGLKSVECVRLLSLRHHAFPVDTNVARILVRLGWVPLQTLPGDLQIHLLNDYPLLDTVQKYIWPRLCHLIIDILYELHYHLITFGKLFCTKKHPNCNACPMRAECRHFASAYASAKLRLDGPKDKHMTPESSVPMEQSNQEMVAMLDSGLPKATSEPIVEYPPSPEPEMGDIEDACYESNDEDILTIKLNNGELTQNINSFVNEKKTSKALIVLSPEVASIPTPKLKYVGRLRTVHHVYELPDEHPLLAGYQKRDSEDRCPYLLAIWNSNELTDSFQDSKQESKYVVGACGSREIVQYQNDEIVRGTILIPIRTANRGSFPLNGTYFQTNEVAADQESSKHPIAIPRSLIWNLNRRLLYCGTSATSICRGMSMEEITSYNRGGYMCVRGFDRATRAPRPLARRFHLCKTRKVDDDS